MSYQCPTKKVIPCAVLCYMVKYANVLSRKEIETFLATLISIKVKKIQTRITMIAITCRMLDTVFISELLIIIQFNNRMYPHLM